MPSGSEAASLTYVASLGGPMQSSATHVGLEELSGGAQGFTPRQVTHTSPSAVPNSTHWAHTCLLDVDVDFRNASFAPQKHLQLSAFRAQQHPQEPQPNAPHGLIPLPPGRYLPRDLFCRPGEPLQQHGSSSRESDSQASGETLASCNSCTCTQPLTTVLATGVLESY